MTVLNPGLADRTFLSRVLGLDDPGQAKVCDLAVQRLVDQDVGSPQVPVDVVLPLDVGHAFRYLPRHRTTEIETFFL